MSNRKPTRIVNTTSIGRLAQVIGNIYENREHSQNITISIPQNGSNTELFGGIIDKEPQ